MGHNLFAFFSDWLLWQPSSDIAGDSCRTLFLFLIPVGLLAPYNLCSIVYIDAALTASDAVLRRRFAFIIL